MDLSNDLLKRFWFETAGHRGIGVTAYSVEDAISLIDEEPTLAVEHITSVIEDVDIRDLDQDHVIPNMGPVDFRGIWYPNLYL